MNIHFIKHKIQKHPTLKRCLHRFIMHPVKTRPQWWIRMFSFLYLKRGKGSVIYRSVRKDLPPFCNFYLGEYSVVEDYSCLNNAVGDLFIGNHCRIGLHATIIGPVHLEDHVHVGQCSTLSGLNHNYEDIETPFDLQGINTATITVEEGVWIGASSVLLPGITIGKHSVIAAGSVVTQSIPAYSVCAGVPAKVLKQYDFNEKKWIKVSRN